MIIRTKAKLNGPLIVDIEWDIDALVQEAAASVPIGQHAHDRGIPYANYTPRIGGRLKAEIGNKANWRYRASGNHPYARITLNHPGAAALEFGAHVRASHNRFMAWMSPRYGAVAAWSRKAFSIPARPFAETILARWMARTGVNAAVKVSWAKGFVRKAARYYE